MRLLNAALALSVAACASSPAGNDHALGSALNPVRVHMPAGEREYLSRLRCSDGAAPAFEREGSTAPGPDDHILDIYMVRCANGEPRETQIWMDMYHPPHTERDAPPGFTQTSR